MHLVMEGIMKLLRLRISILFMVWMSLFLMAFQTEEFSTLEAVVVWLITQGGAMTLFGYIKAYLLENWPAWHDFPTWVKTLAPIVFAGLLGIIGQSLLDLGLLSYVPIYVQVILLAGINYFFGQRAYKGIKDSSYGATARGDKVAG
jgi:hypothetical protein